MFDKISEGRYWDKPWSLVSGCTKISPGCKHCWALGMEHRFQSTEAKSLDGSRKVESHHELLDIPLKRKKPTVFAVWNDLFHEDVPVNFLEDVIATMTLCPQHVFLLLTKRAQRLKLMTSDRLRVSRTDTWPIKNLWLGVTVCNQTEADEKIPLLLQIPAAVRFISIEPMLGPINISWSLDHPKRTAVSQLDLVILGGETGPGASPMKTEWVRDVRDQCKAAGVPFFFKAWGPCKEVGRMLYGRTWDELPEAR
jgi:protein gp37